MGEKVMVSISALLDMGTFLASRIVIGDGVMIVNSPVTVRFSDLDLACNRVAKWLCQEGWTLDDADEVAFGQMAADVEKQGWSYFQADKGE